MTTNTCQDYSDEINKLVELQWNCGIVKVEDIDEEQSNVFVGGPPNNPRFVGIFHKEALLKAYDKFVSEIDNVYRGV